MLDPSSEVQKRRQFVAIAMRSPYWAMINIVSFIVFIVEFKCSIIPSWVQSPTWASWLSPSGWLFLKHLISASELLLALLFLVNAIYNVYIYVYFKRFMPPLELTPEEAIIFGVERGELGFVVREKSPVTPEKQNQTCNQQQKLHFSIAPSPAFNITPNTKQHNSLCSSSLDSTGLSSRLFNNDSPDVKATSWSYIRHRNAIQDSSFERMSPNTSFTNIDKKNDSMLRLRKSNSFLLRKAENSPTSGAIASKETLERFLQNQERKDEELQEILQSAKRYGTPEVMTPTPSTPHPNANLFLDVSGSPIVGGGGPMMMSGAWNRSFSPVAANGSPPTAAAASVTVPYQPAIKTTSAPSSQEKAESLNYSTKAVEKILAKLEVDDARLNQMVENIRKWISQTILVRLVKEIDSINKLIQEKGYIDSLIGETSIKQLKYLAQHKKDEFPTLEQLVPFLEVTDIRNIENNIAFQQYLVRRIKDLAKGGCMIEFIWDGGGSYNYRPWNDSIITDSELILYVFCVYMDSRLLFNPAAPEGKPFTSQYFKPYGGPGPKSDTYIQQDKPYPPHYSLMLKSEHFDIPRGRNNLFYTLLVFLHHIKVKNFGLLGRINLGPSGLNIAWVIDK